VTIEALRETGVRAVFARTAMDIGDLVPPSLLETPEEAVKAADRVVQRYRDEPSSRVSVMVGPNTPGVSAGPDMARAMTEYAQAAGVPQSTHIAESRSARDVVAQRYGVDGVVRWLDSVGALEGPILAAHSVHVDEGEIAMMRERGIAIAHNPVSNLFLGDGIAPIWEAQRAGVGVALGTDGAASNNRQDMFEVLKLAALLQRRRGEDGLAFSPGLALRMATIDAARAIGLGDAIGSIEPGKRADLVVVDLRRAPRNVALHNPVSQLVHCAAADDVDTVIVDGSVVIAAGEPTSFDGPALLARAQHHGRELAHRLEARAPAG
jgi:5-methylthioadenosine/S-adenosylhomocysteine deaminase